MTNKQVLTLLRQSKEYIEERRWNRWASRTDIKCTDCGQWQHIGCGTSCKTNNLVKRIDKAIRKLETTQ